MFKNGSLAIDLGIETGIRNVEALRSQLAAALSEYETVIVSVHHLTAIDISVLQLLASAHRTASAAGKSITLSAPSDGALQHALRRVGFVDAGGSPLVREGDFWTLHPVAKDHAA